MGIAPTRIETRRGRLRLAPKAFEAREAGRRAAQETKSPGWPANRETGKSRAKSLVRRGLTHAGRIEQV